MKLVYCWVEEVHHLNNVGFNLCGEVRFRHEWNPENNELRLFKEDSGQTPADFFQMDGKGFSSITALVGENGSGKSLLLEQLAWGLTETNTPDEDFYRPEILATKVLVFKNTEGFSYSIFSGNNSPSVTMIENDVLISIEESKPFVQTVYYDPFYMQTRNLPHKCIHVSSDFLLNRDLEISTGKQHQRSIPSFYYIRDTSGYFLHKTKEFLRQIKYVGSDNFKNIIIHENIFIPEKVNFGIVPINISWDYYIRIISDPVLADWISKWERC